MRKQGFILAYSNTTRPNLWEQLLLSVAQSLLFFLFLGQFGIVSKFLQMLIVTMLCKQKVL